ncbi:hypothetical protein ACFQ6B_15915 [Streptomyces wedmorensis]|uniref:Uncharacterized protein n=1 Tax=Streptomyces wedmorensis TaxID=43759 RepID=A0ABW6IN58_STRWE
MAAAALDIAPAVVTVIPPPPLRHLSTDRTTVAEHGRALPSSVPDSGSHRDQIAAPPC